MSILTAVVGHRKFTLGCGDATLAFFSHRSLKLQLYHGVTISVLFFTKANLGHGYGQYYMIHRRRSFDNIYDKLFPNRWSWVHFNPLIAVCTKPIVIGHRAWSLWIVLTLYIGLMVTCSSRVTPKMDEGRLLYLLLAFFQDCICRKPRSRYRGLRNVEALPRWVLLQNRSSQNS